MYDVDLNIDKLEQLFEGSEALNTSLLGHHSQAAVWCLQRQGHNSPKEGKVAGDWSGSMSISWEQENQEDLEKGWDKKDAIEWGATMIALSLVAHENYRILQRAQSLQPSKEEDEEDEEEEGGFDYWLGNNSNNPDEFDEFEDRVKLEISGILKGAEGKINARIRKKVKRLQESNCLNIEAIILVVEFSNPKAKICQIR